MNITKEYIQGIVNDPSKSAEQRQAAQALLDEYDANIKTYTARFGDSFVAFVLAWRKLNAHYEGRKVNGEAGY